MDSYWEQRFSLEGAMWKFEPADSAEFALELFRSEGINRILIPGFGYGRNAEIFIRNGIDVTGIEISASAISLARNRGLTCTIHHGSVTEMPFDGRIFDGIFCYALIHLLGAPERKKFLASCYNQLAGNGIMVFIVTSKESPLYGKGRYLSKDRYEPARGLKVFFYDQDSLEKEFSDYGFFSCEPVYEPVKFMEGEEPISLLRAVCRKKL